MQLLDIVLVYIVYVYRGIKVYDSFAFYLYIQHACLPAETIHIEACSSLELLYESVYMCALLIGVLPICIHIAISPPLLCTECLA